MSDKHPKHKHSGHNQEHIGLARDLVGDITKRTVDLEAKKEGRPRVQRMGSEGKRLDKINTPEDVDEIISRIRNHLQAAGATVVDIDPFGGHTEQEAEKMLQKKRSDLITALAERGEQRERS